MLERFRHYRWSVRPGGDEPEYYGWVPSWHGWKPIWGQAKQVDLPLEDESSIEIEDNDRNEINPFVNSRKRRSALLAVPEDPWWHVNSYKFNVLSAAVTLAYAILVGVETDYGVSNFMALEGIFAMFLGIEILIRGYQLRDDFVADYWNLWDCILLASAVLDLYVLPLISTAFKDSDYHDALQRIRLFRTLRVVRLFRHFHDLVNIFNAFKEALSVVLWLSLLILILDYICAIFLTQMIGTRAYMWGDNEPKITQWFGTIADSMQTLFVVQTLSDWNKIAAVVMEVAPREPVMLFCVAYILLASYTMVSLITGVICESLMMAQQDDNERKVQELEEDKTRFYGELKNTLAQFDTDESGKITPDEVQEALRQHPGVLTQLHALDIHVDHEGILEIVRRCETKDGVPIERLADTLIAVSGEAKSAALVNFQNHVEDELSSLKRDFHDLKTQMRRIADHLNND